MSEEAEAAKDQMEVSSKTVVKKPFVSIPFLVIVVGLGVVAYLSGPWVMTRIMYWQERNQAYEAQGVGDIADDAEGDNGADSGQQPGREGRGGRGGGNPEAFFARLDQDGNGKIEGEEISERMADRVSTIDTDQDEVISKEEFLAAVASRSGGRDGSGRPDGGRPEGQNSERPGRPQSESDSAEAAEPDENSHNEAPQSGN